MRTRRDQAAHGTCRAEPEAAAKESTQDVRFDLRRWRSMADADLVVCSLRSVRRSVSVAQP